MRSLQSNIPIWEYGILYVYQQNWRFTYGPEQINVDYDPLHSFSLISVMNKITSTGGWRFMNSITYPSDKGNVFVYFFERLKPDDTL